jgi:Ca2+-binding EF-hand superfamily protein
MEQAKLFSEEHIKSVFRMIDSDNNGYVERAELLAVLERHGTTMLNGKSVDEIIQSCDKDGNGLIDYNEFKASLLG